jgi:hypothetical protein
MLISVPEERSASLIKRLVLNETLYNEVVGRIGDDGEPGTVTIER